MKIWILIPVLLGSALGMGKLGIAALSDIETIYWEDSVFDGTVKQSVTDSVGNVKDTVVAVYAHRWVMSVTFPVKIEDKVRHITFIVPMDMDVEADTFYVKKKP